MFFKTLSLSLFNKTAPTELTSTLNVLLSTCDFWHFFYDFADAVKRNRSSNRAVGVGEERRLSRWVLLVLAPSPVSYIAGLSCSYSYSCCSCCCFACSIHFCLIFMGHLRRQRCAACLCIRKIHFRLTVRIRETSLSRPSVSVSVSVSVCLSDRLHLAIYSCVCLYRIVFCIEIPVPLQKLQSFISFFQNFEVVLFFIFFPRSLLLQMPENLSKCLKYNVEDAPSPKMDRTEQNLWQSRCHFYLIKETL